MAKPNVSGRRLGGSVRVGGAANRNPQYVDATNSSIARINEVNANTDAASRRWQNNAPGKADEDLATTNPDAPWAEGTRPAWA